MMKDTILFTSDCFSEDRNASLIATELQKIFKAKNDDTKIVGASLVSEGNDYKNRGIEVITNSYVPPSGGFATQSIRGFLADLFSGSLSIPGKFVKIIKKQKEKFKLAVVIGDVFLLWLTKRALKGTGIPILFYIHSKTDYIEPHYKIEERIIRNIASDVFARDQFSADNMSRHNIPVQFLGSVIMDDLKPGPDPLRLDKKIPTVGIMPGTRGEALDNFQLILKTVEWLAESRPLNFASAMVGSLTDQMIRDKFEPEGWEWLDEKPHPAIVKGKAKVIIARKAFINVVQDSDVLIGLTGAANEQAVGLGKPVIAFTGIGPQTTRRRFTEQERLLGGGMKYIQDYPGGVVQEVLSLLDDKKRREEMGRLGKERMGGPGGAEKIARFIYGKYLNQ